MTAVITAVIADTYMSGRHICHMTAVVTYVVADTYICGRHRIM